MSQYPYDTPLEVSPVDGEVVITGPNGVAAAFTPPAARRSAQLLADAADAAERGEGDDPAPPR